MTVANKDYFSKQAQEYALYRPNYPEELFKYLSSQTSSHDMVWDCATGTGQAAISLTHYYKKIIGTDLSSKQIEHAQVHPNVIYYSASCERSGLSNHSVDLITVAQAAHWFNMPLFEEECRRVGKEGSIVAIWTYNLFKINNEIDSIIDNFYWNILKGYWPKGREHVEQAYEHVNLSLEKLHSPEFSMTKLWTFNQLVGYLSSWSALQKYLEVNDSSPVELVKQDLAKAWGDIETTKTVSWPITLKVYRL